MGPRLSLVGFPWLYVKIGVVRLQWLFLTLQLKKHVSETIFIFTRAFGHNKRVGGSTYIEGWTSGVYNDILRGALRDNRIDQDEEQNT